MGGIATIIIALLVASGQCSGAGGGGFSTNGLPSAIDPADIGAPAAQAAPGVTCDTETARLLCDVTSSVQDFWTAELPSSLGTQYERTQTVFFTGATGTGCGSASSQTGPFYCPADGLVYFDLDFLGQLQSRFGAQGDFATAYITAHEYGHHVQNLLGLSRQVNEASQQQPSRANELSIRLELQADCLAGVWGASVQDQLDGGDLEEGLNAAAAVGDDQIQIATQGRTDPESWNHGSSEDRVRWFRRGFDSGDPNVCDTFTEDAPISSLG